MVNLIFSVELHKTNKLCCVFVYILLSLSLLYLFWLHKSSRYHKYNKNTGYNCNLNNRGLPPTTLVYKDMDLITNTYLR